MNEVIGRLLDRHSGVIGLPELKSVPRHVIDYAVRTGAIRRAFPSVYVAEDGWPSRAAAALRYAGDPAALSHRTALGCWRLPGGSLDPPVHVLVPAAVRRGRPEGIVVHRRAGFTAEPPEVVVRGGFPTCRLERAVVDSWGLLGPDTRRAAVITAVAERMTTPQRLLDAVGVESTVPGRRELLRLLNLLGHGCRSELELWGYDRVLTGPGLPTLEWNVPVRVRHRTVYLDLFHRETAVNVELDGAKWHTSTRDRERDTRRDAALAALGILVVRFTHDQLVRAPEAVRQQLIEIIAVRSRAERFQDLEQCAIIKKNPAENSC